MWNEIRVLDKDQQTTNSGLYSEGSLCLFSKFPCMSTLINRIAVQFRYTYNKLLALLYLANTGLGKNASHRQIILIIFG